MPTRNKFKKGFVKFKDLYEYVKSYVAKYLELQYKGAWNASTNTPTLTDGVGNNGDFYRVSVAGTQNLGSGSIEFTLGDEVRYNETLGIWQKFDTGVSYVPVNKAGDTMTGDLGFSSNGRRITGDLSNSTRSNRLSFQSSTTNGNTIVQAIPNGAATIGAFVSYGSSDANNASFLQTHAENGLHVGLNSGKTGTGTTRNLVFQIDSVTKAYLDALTFAFNLSGRLEPSSNTESLSATKTLTSTSPQYQFLNPNGSNRDVTLPSATTNMLFIIKNTGSAGNTLTVKDSGGSAITGGTIANTVAMGFYYNGSSWQLI